MSIITQTLCYSGKMSPTFIICMCDESSKYFRDSFNFDGKLHQYITWFWVKKISLFLSVSRKSFFLNFFWIKFVVPKSFSFCCVEKYNIIVKRNAMKE